MADKRIGQIDQATAFDEDADHILILQGTQRNLRRLLGRRLPSGFDLHDDVANELTTLQGIDRLVISDESAAGAPQRYVKLSTLRSFMTNAFGFDLHDDVPTELAAAASTDRLLISDEDEAGDPQKWISFANLLASINPLKIEKLTHELDLHGDHAILSHNLGRIPAVIQPRMICKQASAGYSAGDELLFGMYSDVVNNSSQSIVQCYDATATRISVRTASGNMVIITKTGGSVNINSSRARWRIGLTLIG